MPVWILSALGLLKKAAGAVLSLIRQYPLQCALIAALVAVAWLWRANSHLRDGIKAERAAHAQTVANFRKAQTQAEAQQKANLVRVAKAQDAISERISDDFQTRLADARARYDKLRAKGNRSAPGDNPVPATGQGSGQPVEAPDQDGFSLADRLTATEQALQLDALITWVEEQSKVETSPR